MAVIEFLPQITAIHPRSAGSAIDARGHFRPGRAHGRKRSAWACFLGSASPRRRGGRG